MHPCDKLDVNPNSTMPSRRLNREPRGQIYCARVPQQRHLQHHWCGSTCDQTIAYRKKPSIFVPIHYSGNQWSSKNGQAASQPSGVGGMAMFERLFERDAKEREAVQEGVGAAAARAPIHNRTVAFIHTPYKWIIKIRIHLYQIRLSLGTYHPHQKLHVV